MFKFLKKNDSKYIQISWHLTWRKMKITLSPVLFILLMVSSPFYVVPIVLYGCNQM